jgi:hypothetical protein
MKLKYRDIDYAITQEPKTKGKWRWTVDFSESKFKTGVSLSKPAAIAKALEVIQDGPTEDKPAKAKTAKAKVPKEQPAE